MLINNCNELINELSKVQPEDNEKTFILKNSGFVFSINPSKYITQISEQMKKDKKLPFYLRNYKGKFTAEQRFFNKLRYTINQIKKQKKIWN